MDTPTGTKKYACMFCDHVVAKLPRHIARKHADEPLVARFTALPKKDPRRNQLIAEVKAHGMFLHNVSLLWNGQANNPNSDKILEKRRPPVLRGDEDYLPCDGCK